MRSILSENLSKYEIKRGFLYSEDPVITNYLVNSKNIRYSGVIQNYQKFIATRRNHYFYSFDTVNCKCNALTIRT